jgi:hypothetical protein
VSIGWHSAPAVVQSPIAFDGESPINSPLVFHWDAGSTPAELNAAVVMDVKPTNGDRQLNKT